MKLVNRKNLSEAVIEQIKQYILSQQLKPGDRLPTEQELADQLGVSRISVREATKALAFMGIIRSAPRRGLTVGEVDMQRLTDYLGFHFAIGGYPMEMLLRTRIIIETGVLPYTCEAIKRNPAILDKLMDHVERIGQATEDVDLYIREDVAFHRTLVEASGIEPLLAFADLINIFFHRFRESVARGNQRGSGNEHHRQIVEALRKGKPARAQDILREHFEYYFSQNLS